MDRPVNCQQLDLLVCAAARSNKAGFGRRFEGK